MVVGNQASVGSINNTLTQYALSLRDTCQNIINFQEFITTTGVAGLETIGFESTDAASVVTMASYMNTIAEVFNGDATQSAEFDFSNALSGLYAGG
jgi:hypothetical protein